MQTQFANWMAQLAADGMDARLLSIVRGQAWEVVLPIAEDVSAETFTFTVSLSPGASVLQAGTVTVGSYSGGVTNVTLALNSTEVGTIATAAGDSDGDGVAEVVFELNMNGKRITAGIIPISSEA